MTIELEELAKVCIIIIVPVLVMTLGAWGWLWRSKVSEKTCGARTGDLENQIKAVRSEVKAGRKDTRDIRQWVWELKGTGTPVPPPNDIENDEECQL